MSFTNVDLPEPDTPVTETKQPSGISTSIFFKLCSLAPLMVTQSPLGALRSCGVEINRFPEMYWPVMDSLFFSIAKLSRSGQSLPTSACAGPYIDNVVSDTDCFFIVLNN